VHGQALVDLAIYQGFSAFWAGPRCAAGLTVPNAGPWQALVCDFHVLAVDSGEDFYSESETKELVSPLRLVNFAVASKGRGKTVTLMFGRDGVEDERTPEVRMGKEMLQRIIDMLP